MIGWYYLMFDYLPISSTWAILLFALMILVPLPSFFRK